MEIEEGQDEEYDSNTCIICNVATAPHRGPLIKIQEKGLSTLREASLQRGDNELITVLDVTSTVLIHRDCRRDYTDKRRIKRHLDIQEKESTQRCSSKCLRSSSTFEWKDDCFFCGKSIKAKSEETYSVRTLPFHANVLAKCNERDDEWGLQVKGRLQDCVDLVAVDAVYHKYCHTVFMSGKKAPPAITGEKGRRGRPECQEMNTAFLELCEWLERSPDNNLYSLDELCQKMKELTENDEVYSPKRLKQRLEEKYEKYIVFAEIQGKKNVVCFREMSNYLINSKWYEDRKKDICDEKQRIILTAAKIILAEIRELQFQREYYPTPEQIGDTEHGFQWLTPSMQTFLQTLIPSPVKQVSIGQCILHACCPRLGIPPVLLGLGVEVDHVFGSKWLTNELAQLGYSVTYDEVLRYKQSVVASMNEEQEMKNQFPGSFTQWVADNVDHNIATLDGKGTFHGMGIISASTPRSAGMTCSSSTIIRRLSKKATANITDILRLKDIKIVPYDDNTEMLPMANILYAPIIELQHPYVIPTSTNLHLLWHIGGVVGADSRPQWSGFMQEVFSSQQSPAANIKFLPIISLNPSDKTCLYSTLLFIEEQAKKLNIVTPCVTFDQPLWLKAIEVVNAMKMNIVCRLGGFHMLMSFLGSVGHVMMGSGIEQALITVYGENTIPHILSGKAYARAMRAHYLVESALMNVLLKHIISESDVQEGNEKKSQENSHRLIGGEGTISEISTGGTTSTSAETSPRRESFELPSTSDSQLQFTTFGPSLNELKIMYSQAIHGDACADFSKVLVVEANLRKYKKFLAENSRTARQWLQYLDYVETVKLFVHAERIGDWHLHLFAVSRMLNLFAATGHIQYAKSARLYLQTMYKLPTSHPWLYEQFISNACTIRRSSRGWAGLWPDLVIEQTLMRSIKTRGGLTQGRGFSDNVRLLWVHTMHMCSAVHEAMTSLTKNRHITGEQHVELRTTRRTRDESDLNKVSEWFEVHNPFDISDDALRNLSTGTRAVLGDGINCDDAEDVGARIQKTLDNKKVCEASIRKADHVKTLITLQKGINVGHTVIHIDPSILFLRLITIAERNGNVAEQFKYELTAEPTALFKDGYMRKPDKASLVTILMKDMPDAPQPKVCDRYVLDGGALLHHIRWPTTGTYLDICKQYRRYIFSKYGKSKQIVIVFDGYGDQPSIKDHEHQRRSAKVMSANVKVTEDMSIQTNQNAFLANPHNKRQFISIISKHLSDDGHKVIQASGDADTEIVAASLQIALKGNEVTVVSDDTDILIMLLYHLKSEMANIYFMSGIRRKGETKTISVRHMLQHVGDNVQPHLLFIHAMTGCDTTSALFGCGKGSCVKMLAASKDHQILSEQISDVNSTQDTVAFSGLKFLVKLYGGSDLDSLSVLRYKLYMKMVATGNTLPQPQRLPPTERAAYFHCLRAHLQIVSWKQLSPQALNPLEWGWKFEQRKLSPIMTDEAPASDELLKVIRCKCKMSSKRPCATSVCSCRKYDLKCVMACGHCNGEGCQNAETAQVEGNDEVLDDPNEV